MGRARVLASLAVLALAACGGGEEQEGAEPAAWVNEVCTAVAGWRDELETGFEEVQSTIVGVASLEEARTQLVDFLDETVSRTDTMLSEVEAAGSPAVDEGEALAGDLRSALGEVRTVFADAKADAEALPVDDALAFASAAQDLAVSIGDRVASAGGTFEELDERYDAPELEQAVEDDEICRGLEAG